MSHYLGKMLRMRFEDAVTSTIEALKKERFGIITQIDVKETLKSKIGVDFPAYQILGASDLGLRGAKAGEQGRHYVAVQRRRARCRQWQDGSCRD